MCLAVDVLYEDAESRIEDHTDPIEKAQIEQALSSDDPHNNLIHLMFGEFIEEDNAVNHLYFYASSPDVGFC